MADEININKKRYLIVIDSSLLKGDPGDDGADGTIAAFLPLNSSDIVQDGVVRNGETLDDLLNELLHAVISILNFSANAGSIFEKGQSFSSITFSWTVSDNITSQSISGTNVVPPTLDPADRTAVVSFSPDLDDDGSISLFVDDGTGLTGSQDTSGTNIRFMQKVHWGKDEIPGTINSAFILGLPSSSLQENGGTNFDVTTGTNEYIWIAAPASFGDLSIFAGGFLGGFESKVIVSHTNASGFTENYNVYRSTNDKLGLTHISSL